MTTATTAIVVSVWFLIFLVSFGLYRQNSIYSIKTETYKLLVVIKEWAELGKRAHEASLQQATKTAAKTDKIQETAHQVMGAVERVPDQVVEKMGGPGSGVSQNPWPPPAGG
jgi:hypothetical protein